MESLRSRPGQASAVNSNQCGSRRRGLARLAAPRSGSGGRWGALRLLGVVAVAVPMLLVSCSDADMLLFSGPASLELDGAPQLDGTVSEALDLPPLRVTDEKGNPTPGVEITLEVEEGGGSVAPATVVTDERGRATPRSWMLGRTAGRNVLVARLGDVDELRLEAEGLPGPAEELESAGFGTPSSTVATALPELPAVKVTDRFGNPVRGAEVRFTPDEGSGSVDGTRSESGEDGVAEAGAWTLGPTAGVQRLEAELISDDEEVRAGVTLEVDAVPGPPHAMERVSSDLEEAPRGGEVVEPPAVRIRDEHGNAVEGMPVTFSVLEGGGEVSDPEVVTSSTGLARTDSWILGCVQGANRAAALADGLDDVVFQAEATEAVGLSVNGVHVNQGNQARDGSIGGVAHRAGLLRVMVQARCENDFAPDVQVRLRSDGETVREEVLPAERSSVPEEPDLNELHDTWNLTLPASEVRPGLEVEAVVDPHGDLGIEPQYGFRYPREGGARSLDVEPLAPLRVVFFPVHLTTQVATGQVDEDNVEEYLDDAYRWIPSSEITYEVRDTFATDWDISDRDNLAEVLSDLQAVRTAEGAQDEYYFGVLPASHWMGGLAYRPTAPHQDWRSGLLHDRLPRAASTFGHELGHTLGRQHAPCGDPYNWNEDFPYPDGGIGPPGYDVVDGELRQPEDFADYMSHCRPRWTSDFKYGAILDWRREDPLAVFDEGESTSASSSAAVRSSGMAGDGVEGEGMGLLVWGRIHSEGVVLNPAFTLEADPQLPGGGGPHEIRGFDSTDAEVFAFSFEGGQVATSEDPGERHFAFVVPLARGQTESLHRIEVSGPRGTAERLALASEGTGEPGAAAPEDPKVALTQVGPGLDRLEWEHAAYPAALIRDRESGEILGIARHGEVELRGLSSRQVEVQVSDGVRTRRFHSMGGGELRAPPGDSDHP